MTDVSIKAWELVRNGTQLELTLEGGQHAQEQDVGKQVAVSASGHDFSVGLLAVGMIMDISTQLVDGAIKVVPLPGSDLNLIDLVRALKGENGGIIHLRSCPGPRQPPLRGRAPG